MTLITKADSTKCDVEDSSGDFTSSNKGHEAAKETRMKKRDSCRPTK
jgi:hypothetical protein